MPRYRAAAKFGPWRRGDVFESVDPWYEQLADDGRLLDRLEEVGGDGNGDVQVEDDRS